VLFAEDAANSALAFALPAAARDARRRRDKPPGALPERREIPRTGAGVAFSASGDEAEVLTSSGVFVSAWRLRALARVLEVGC